MAFLQDQKVRPALNDSGFFLVGCYGRPLEAFIHNSKYKKKCKDWKKIRVTLEK